MTLRVKMVCSIGLMIFLVLGTSTLIHIRNVRQMSFEEIQLRSEAIAQNIINYLSDREFMLSIGGEEPDSHMIYTTLQLSAEVINRIYQGYKAKGLSSLCVISLEGVIAAHNDFAKWDIPVNDPRIIDQLSHQKRVTILNETDYHTMIPIISENYGYIGAVDVGISRQGVDAKIQQTLAQSITLFAVFLAVSFGAVTLFIHAFVTNPLRKLTTLGKWVAHGEFDRIPEFQQHPAAPSKKTDRDEIEELTYAFHEMISYFQQIVGIATCIADGELVHSIKPRSDHDVLGIAFQRMIAYLAEMAETASLMSYGVIQQDIHPKSDQDVLGQAFSQMLSYIREVAYLAEKIATGNLQVDITPRSEQDMLNHSLNKMIQYLQNVGRIVEQIAQNNLDIEVLPQSEQDMLNRSLLQMVENLRETQRQIDQSMTEIERQNWIKTGQAELSDIIRREQDPVTLAKAVVTYLSTYLHAQVGALYLTHEEEGLRYLKLTASYAYTRRDAHRDRFRFGEGLVGQVAMEQEAQIYFHLSQNPILINSDEGEIIPTTALLAPIVHEDHVLGVIELGSTGDFTTTDLEFLKVVMKNIALACHGSG